MSPAPKVSIIMACYQAAETLPEAIASALAQTCSEVEVIVSDDGSTDASVAVAEGIARRDRRVRVLTAATNGGPGAARNRALAVARGEWIAVQDCDDLMHPARLSLMIAAAERVGAVGCIDDQLFLDAEGRPTGETLLQGHAPACLDAVSFVHAGTPGSDLPDFGYAKPLLRRTVATAVAYDEGVDIGEDYQYLLEVLCRGAAITVLPDPLYLYRRHSDSISHRMSVETAAAMLRSHDAFEAPPALGPALAARRAALVRGLAFETLVRDLKAHRVLPALAQLARRPGLVQALHRSVRERAARRGPSVPQARDWVLGLHAASAVDPADFLDLADLPNALHQAGAARHLTAVGVAGAKALGYLPCWRVASLIAEPEDAPAIAAVLPRDIVLRSYSTPTAVPESAKQIAQRTLIVSAIFAAALAQIAQNARNRIARSA